MLDQVHLVDVAFGDRSTNDVDRVGVFAFAPARLPRSYRIRTRCRARRIERIGDGGERTGLRRCGCIRTAQILRAAIADVHARDDVVAAEEALVPERGLELVERVELGGHPHTARAACRSQSTPSSRSETGTRPSAEWMSAAASSGAIVRYGKKP